MKRRGREYHDFLSKNLSCSTENLRRGTLPCLFNFGYRNILCLRGLCHEFLSKLFCLTVPEKFVGESLSVSLHCGIEKKFVMRDGGGEGESITIFGQNFLSGSSKKLRWRTLLCCCL